VPHSGPAEIISSEDIGTDNIVFLYEKWVE
jgi:hypothetical protein